GREEVREARRETQLGCAQQPHGAGAARLDPDELTLGDEARDLALEALHGAAQRIADPVRKERIDARRRDSELVARGAQRTALAAGAEVRDALRGRAESAAARVVEAALELFLELDARERAAARIHGHDEPRVGIGRRMARIAHAVRAQEPALGYR